MPFRPLRGLLFYAMPILNYTTKIKPGKTVGEIQARLARHGARHIAIGYDDEGEPVRLTFTMFLRAQPINFRLPSNWQGVYAVMQADRDIPRGLRTEEQARRVAWRIIKDWTEAQLAIIDAGLASTVEVFLPYAVHEDGRTLYQIAADNPQLLLTS